MSIRIKSIFFESGIFFCNQFFVLLLISLLCALITLTIGHIIVPQKEQLSVFIDNLYLDRNIGFFELVKNMSLKQQCMFIRIVITSIFSNLIGHSILLGYALFFIKLTLEKQSFNYFHIMKISLPIFVKLFFLLLLITLLIQIGIMFFILPGIYLAISFSFAPIILIQEKIGILGAIHKSMKLSWKSLRLVTIGIIVWLMIKLLLLFLVSNFAVLTANFSILIFNTLNNLVFLMLLIYLFRVFILINR